MKYRESFRVSFFLFSLTVFAVSAGQAAPRTPEPGAKERMNILDAVRDPLEASIHQKVIFVVDHMKVEGDWAFLIATPKTKDGGKINYKGTVFEDDADFADELTVALLKKKRNRWFIVTHAYFTTDVWWHGIWDDYKAPQSIFPR
ncbi:MAG: hypothetical protein QM496_22575 [Verrucomicrobiota bacterium]